MGFDEFEDNLFRIEVPLPNNPLRELNVYLVRADAAHPGWRGRSLLIDNGFNRPECMDAILSVLRELDVDITTLDFFVTHLHSDHCGLTSKLLDMASTEAMVFASPGDMVNINMFSRQTFRQEDAQYYMKSTGMPQETIDFMTTGHPGTNFAVDRPCPFTPALDEDIFHYGAIHFQVCRMPGHTPDLLCLYDAQRKILISSDHILGDITPNITHWGEVRDSLGNYLGSLRKAAQLDVQLCLPGHRTVFADCRGRIEALERHHAARLDEVRNILDREGPSGAYAVASRMTWSIRAKSWNDFPRAQHWFACGEALAHLVHLHTLGEVRRTTSKGLTTFRLANK